MTPYLYEKENPHAPVRANGKRFWGYPQRTKPVRIITVHTAESTPDYIGADGGAEAVAAFQSMTSRPSSYHEIVDSDSHVVMLPYQAVAFGAVGANANGWHLSFATHAHLWGSKPAWWRDATIRRGAGRARLAAKHFGIPARRLSRAQIADGLTKGFASHEDTEAVFGTPGRRSDPGRQFPWDDFLEQVANIRREDMMRRGDVGGDVKGVQRRLAQLGHYRGDLDGDFGPKTEEAVKEYQQRRGLDVSGQVTVWTAVDLQAIAHSTLAHGGN